MAGTRIRGPGLATGLRAVACPQSRLTTSVWIVSLLENTSQHLGCSGVQRPVVVTHLAHDIAQVQVNQARPGGLCTPSGQPGAGCRSSFSQQAHGTMQELQPDLCGNGCSGCEGCDGCRDSYSFSISHNNGT
jgi:hypothetical protein